jgi:hypothetical protein
VHKIFHHLLQFLLTCQLWYVSETFLILISLGVFLIFLEAGLRCQSHQFLQKQHTWYTLEHPLLEQHLPLGIRVQVGHHRKNKFQVFVQRSGGLIYDSKHPSGHLCPFPGPHIETGMKKVPFQLSRGSSWSLRSG